MRAFVLIIVLLFGSPSLGQQPKEITNSIEMKLVLIHTGSFTMGSPKEELERTDNEMLHEVTISKSLYLGVYEVTQGQYEKVMGINPSEFKGATNPVEQVSWEDAISFCKTLSEMPEEKAAGREYRLPTESEWEYSCRASSGAAYSFGDSAGWLGEYAWFDENSQNMTHPVGEKKANRWGLYDMHGNVAEWCQDWYRYYPTGEVTDPQGHRMGSHRACRGGGWLSIAANCRTAHRGKKVPTRTGVNAGFRVALSLPDKQPEAASIK